MTHRIRTFQGLLAGAGMAAAVVWYSRDLLYYTGACQPSWLVVLPDTYRLFIRSGYAEAKQQVTIGANLMRASGPAFSLSGVGLDAAVPAGPSRRVILPGDASPSGERLRVEDGGDTPDR